VRQSQLQNTITPDMWAWDTFEMKTPGGALKLHRTYAGSIELHLPVIFTTLVNNKK
jgi:hypothetical protein